MFFGIVPAVDIHSQTIRFMRSPGTGLVWVQSCSIREDGVDNGPSGRHPVFPHEQHGISLHGISEKTLIGVNLIRSLFFDGRKLRGHGDEFVTWTFHSGVKAKRNLTWTETKAEMIARFAGQIVQRRSPKFDQHFGSRNWQALSGANQEWHSRSMWFSTTSRIVPVAS